MPMLKGGGYNHNCRIAWGGYEISWQYDTKHGRIRYPQIMKRQTDEEGAKMFCKKWNIPFPGKEEGK